MPAGGMESLQLNPVRSSIPPSGPSCRKNQPGSAIVASALPNVASTSAFASLSRFDRMRQQTNRASPPASVPPPAAGASARGGDGFASGGGLSSTAARLPTLRWGNSGEHGQKLSPTGTARRRSTGSLFALRVRARCAANGSAADLPLQGLSGF